MVSPPLGVQLLPSNEHCRCLYNLWVVLLFDALGLGQGAPLLEASQVSWILCGYIADTIIPTKTEEHIQPLTHPKHPLQQI